MREEKVLFKCSVGVYTIAVDRTVDGTPDKVNSYSELERGAIVYNVFSTKRKLPSKYLKYKLHDRVYSSHTEH